MAESSGGRLAALDILRGLAVAGMLLVNSPGDWSHIYPQLDHAPWNGWTFADLVFPSFLFCVGASTALSLGKRSRPDDALRIVRRAVILVLLGLFLQALPDFDLAHLRFPGVLQRIGVCYALGAFLFLATARKRDDGGREVNIGAVAGVIVLLLAGYWALLRFTPVPGFGAGRLDSWGSLPAYVDRAVFGVDHMWKYATTEGRGVTYDPEGLLSTIPSLANVLFGMIAARMVQRAPHFAWLRVSLLAIGLIAIGLLFDPAFPINKRLWTSSFALFTSGVTMAAFGVLLLITRSHLVERLAYPLRVLGGNAILAYVFSWLLEILGGTPLIPGPPTRGLQEWTYSQAHGLIGDPYLASLACALLVLGFITAILAPLQTRGMHLRL